MKKYEEQIGVRLPDGRRFMATVSVGPLESDEEILCRMTKEVGTIFHVNGQKLLVTSLNPYTLKNISEEEANSGVVLAPPSPEPPKSQPLEGSRNETKAKTKTKEEAEPKSERRPATIVPQVGERWRPKDPRRIASFIVKEVRGDEVLTDDGRSIDLGRFWRYVKLEDAPKAEGQSG